jgi:hypothetical protein
MGFNVGFCEIVDEFNFNITSGISSQDTSHAMNSAVDFFVFSYLPSVPISHSTIANSVTYLVCQSPTAQQQIQLLT